MNSRTACIHHPDLRNTYIERVWTPRLRPGTKRLMNSPKDAKAARQRTYDAARRQRRLDNAAIVIERGIDKVLWASDAHQIEVEPNYRRLKLNYPRDDLITLLEAVEASSRASPLLDLRKRVSVEYAI